MTVAFPRPTSSRGATRRGRRSSGGRRRGHLRLGRLPRGRRRRIQRACLTARDATPAADDLYDLYVYDRSPAYRLLASTHPFAAEGVTDTNANGACCSQPACAPASLTLSPQALGPPGRYYVAVNRAKSGGTKTGDPRRLRLHRRRVSTPAGRPLPLTNVDAPDPVLVGNELTYTLTARTTAPSVRHRRDRERHASGRGRVRVGVGQPGHVHRHRAGDLLAGSLASGTTATVTVKRWPSAAGTATSTASVTSAETDPVSANNTALRRRP